MAKTLACGAWCGEGMLKRLSMIEESQQPDALEASPLPRSSFEHRLMFVVFVLLSFVLFVPIILLPIVRDQGALLEEEGRLRERNRLLQAELDRRVALRDAFESDAVVNERLAMLDLHYRKPGEAVLAVLPKHYQAAPPPPEHVPVYQSVLKIPETWPEPVRRAEAWAERYGLIELYLHPDVRPVLMLMSGGLIVAAFVLFAPRLPRSPVNRTRFVPPAGVASGRGGRVDPAPRGLKPAARSASREARTAALTVGVPAADRSA